MEAVKYIFQGRWKTILLATFIIGLVMFIAGTFLDAGNTQRMWATLLFTNFFFLGIALIGLFFVSVFNIGQAGWHANFKRIPEAMSTYIPLGALLMIPILWFGHHDLYHWTHEGLTDINDSHYDKLIAHKAPYLNMPFFMIRAVIFVVLWSVLAWLIRKNSLAQDAFGKFKDYRASKWLTAAFIVVFGISSSMASWDWFMSIDPHWYSTLYGWYTFSNIFVAGLCAIVIFIIVLKKAGYLSYVSREHVHDLTKMIFGFSVFWAYLWISQFLLIWYANIPEETLYYEMRFESFKFPFFLSLFINFVFPFLILMTAKAKRNMNRVLVVASILIFGHWLDFYNMTMPGVFANSHGGHHAGFGLVEFGLFFAYIGLFGYITLRSLSKASLVPLNDPYVRESLQHHT